ncbi:MAG: hypothetical protein NTW16_01075 [Bacteroidetes bacterium]|nr:hypothetical protein [Bacteroidota bacterium]
MNLLSKLDELSKLQRVYQKLNATPLLPELILVEATDLILPGSIAASFIWKAKGEKG